MALIFWTFMICWAALGLWATRTNRDFFAWSNSLFVWVLFLLVGLRVFGFPSA